jgi:hypothetical protein
MTGRSKPEQAPATTVRIEELEPAVISWEASAAGGERVRALLGDPPRPAADDATWTFRTRDAPRSVSLQPAGPRERSSC